MFPDADELSSRSALETLKLPNTLADPDGADGADGAAVDRDTKGSTTPAMRTNTSTQERLTGGDLQSSLRSSTTLHPASSADTAAPEQRKPVLPFIILIFLLESTNVICISTLMF